MSTFISAVVPALNEAARIGAVIADLRAVGAIREIIVVDGGSADATARIAANAGARVLTIAGGRGAQLRAGAAAARGGLLFFVHADVRIGAPARDLLTWAAATAAADDRTTWVFELRIDAPGLGYRVIELGANARARFARLPYGDQGLLLSRSAYERAGGFQPLPMMEDLALIRVLRRSGRGSVRVLPAAVTVSARRWEREGIVRRTVMNTAMLASALLGVSPERLSRWYRPHAATAAVE